MVTRDGKELARESKGYWGSDLEIGFKRISP